jgi:membrane-associated protease RseP (regulator of RpoE activity)
MRNHRLLIAAVALALLAPAAADAQVTVRAHAQSRGMLGLLTEPVMAAGVPATTQRVLDVVPGSAAAQAGLAAGDTIIRLNGLPASDQVMRAPLEAGDTIVLRVRRAGTERDVRLVAQPRSEHGFPAGAVRVLPDTVRDRVAIIMDRLHADLDTLRRGQIFLRGLRGDSGVVYHFGRDSLFVLPFDRDSLRALTISVRAGVLRSQGAWLRALPDSAWLRDGRAITFARPGDIAASAFTLGMRSIAGAELAELNPGLAEYFGVVDGVLVIDARDGTPAARAGIRPGDVIVRVGQTPVSSIAALRRAIDAAPARSTMQIRVLRRGQPIDLELQRE